MVDYGWMESVSLVGRKEKIRYSNGAHKSDYDVTKLRQINFLAQRLFWNDPNTP